MLFRLDKYRAARPAPSPQCDRMLFIRLVCTNTFFFIYIEALSHAKKMSQPKQETEQFAWPLVYLLLLRDI